MKAVFQTKYGYTLRARNEIVCRPASALCRHRFLSRGVILCASGMLQLVSDFWLLVFLCVYVFMCLRLAHKHTRTSMRMQHKHEAADSKMCL